MNDDDGARQSAENLETLLDMLANPLDNSVPLSVVRNAAGQVVALRSGQAEYPVVDNVPRLIPALGEGNRGDLPLWRWHQKKMWQEYQDGDEGVFSSDDNDMGMKVGETITQKGGGLCLDVGCGALTWPVYMAASGEGVRWFGIDPFAGESPRRFPFVQALGEYLPFLPEVFDNALYASTIYHMLDPQRSLKRVYSVLKPGGRVFLWYHACTSRWRYLAWRGLRGLGFKRMYNKNYPWAFTQRSLQSALERAGFVMEESVYLCEGCEDLATCKYRNEYLAIARRR